MPRMERLVEWWAAGIAVAGAFCAGMLTVTDANAEMLALKCSIEGQEPLMELNIDLTNRTIDLRRESFPQR